MCQSVGSALELRCGFCRKSSRNLHRALFSWKWETRFLHFASPFLQSPAQVNESEARFYILKVYSLWMNHPPPPNTSRPVAFTIPHNHETWESLGGPAAPVSPPSWLRWSFCDPGNIISSLRVPDWLLWICVVTPRHSFPHFRTGNGMRPSRWTSEHPHGVHLPLFCLCCQGDGIYSEWGNGRRQSEAGHGASGLPFTHVTISYT